MKPKTIGDENQLKTTKDQTLPELTTQEQLHQFAEIIIDHLLNQRNEQEN
jgi:hypothetical protein